MLRIIKLDKCFTKALLFEANDAAIRENRNRHFDVKFLKQFPDDQIFPVVHMFYHKKGEIRVTIDFSELGTSFLDMSILRYDALSSAIVDKEGYAYLEDEKSVQARRPYPNNREWQEVIVKKPVRKQRKFRDTVLEAYDYKCAICDVSNPSILRAAHIWPVSDGGQDNIKNGICLCVNHEVAYDKELFVITPEGRITLNTDDNLKIDRTTIRFPKEEKNYPHSDNFSRRKEFYERKRKKENKLEKCYLLHFCL